MSLRTKRASKGYLCAQSRLVVRPRRLHVGETCFMRPRLFQLTIRSRGNSDTSTTTTTTKNKSEKAKIKSAELPSNRYHAKLFAPIRVLSRARMLFFYAEWQLQCTLNETRARVLAIHGRVFERKIRLPLDVNFFCSKRRERQAVLSSRTKNFSLSFLHLSFFAHNTNALSLSLSLSLCTHSRCGRKSNQNRHRPNEYQYSSCIRNRFESFARIRRRS